MAALATILPALVPAVGAGALMAAQLVSTGMVARRLGRPAPLADPATMPAISLLRPVCGLEQGLEATLGSSFAQQAADYEVIFCVARADDPALPLLHRLIAAHPQVPARILIEDSHATGNPKLNNLLKGWDAARHDWIVMADSNLFLPPEYLRRLIGAWTPGTGMVSSPAWGSAPDGMAARIEAAFLNTHQARWQLFGDEIGQGFAQGKTLFWRRDVLEAGGGPLALGRDLAEDVGSTKLVRRQGLKVRVTGAPFAQPLGRRDLRAVWSRQRRWAQIRHAGFPGLYRAEILSGALPGTLLAALAVALAGGGAAGVAMAVLAYLALWYAAEAALARRGGWPHGPGDLLAFLLRDLALPALWVLGFSNRGFNWRGNDMATEVQPAAGSAGAGAAGQVSG